jgi:HAD superfamily hydrolase (TIGR01549 family)
MTHLEAIFFDLGDTIIDLGEGLGGYERRLAQRVGRVYDVLLSSGASLPDRQVFCEALASGSEGCYQRSLAEQQGLDIYDVMRWFFDQMGVAADEQMVQAAGAAYCAGATSAAPLRAGALEVLTQLRACGLRLGVISNTLQPAQFMDESLARRGLLAFFAVRAYSSEVRVAKPSPGIFKAALAALDVPPERALHVGDRLVADIAGAHAVGMKAVHIDVPGRAPESHDGILPDARIAELPELLTVLPQLFTKALPR